jgi:membrane-associated protease RseP (regulator of RpoE activity)
LGFGDKAFDGVASFLEKTVTEESHIETAISGVEPLLKAFQGDTDARVSSALAKQKAELEKPAPDLKPGETKPADPNDIRTIIADAIKPLQQKIEGYEKRETQKQLQQQVLTAVRESFKTDPEKKGFDAWVKGRIVNIEDSAKLEEITTELKTGYTEFRQEMINQGVISEIPASGTPAAEKSVEEYQKIMNGEKAADDPGTVKLKV